MSEETQQKPTWFNPNYPPLKSGDDVAEAAFNGQFVKYPQIVRKGMDEPPSKSQIYTNVSYMLFETPVKVKNSRKPVYGFMKIRGSFPSKEEAEADARRIISEVDSKYQIRLAPTGAWIPITEDDRAIEELYDVRNSDDEIHLRDKAVKEKEAEERRIARELKENEEKLKNETDVHDQPESLDFYTMNRVTEMRLVENRDAELEKLRDIENKIAFTRMKLKKLEQNNPDYKEQWIDHYNAGRKDKGIHEFVPSTDQFKEYENTELKELIENYPDYEEKVDNEISKG